MWPVDKCNVMLQTGAFLVAKGLVCYCQSSSSLECRCSSVAEASSLAPFCCIRFWSGLFVPRCLHVKSCAPSCSVAPRCAGRSRVVAIPICSPSVSIFRGSMSAKMTGRTGAEAPPLKTSHHVTESHAQSRVVRYIYRRP